MKFREIDTIIFFLIIIAFILVILLNMKKTPEIDEIKIDNIFIEKYHKKKKIKKIFKFNQIWDFLDYTKIFNYDNFSIFS